MEFLYRGYLSDYQSREHFNRLLARARFRDMVRDARPFAARLGGARFATMLASGFGQLIRRRFA